MRLLHSPTSPYARKVRMVILEKGLDEQVILEAANPMGAEGDTVRRANPLGKVPCLLLNDGSSLFDSPVIVEYLDMVKPEPRLIPTDGAARWTVLRIQALADGIMDAAVSARMESLRPEGQKSTDMIAHWLAGVTRGLAQLGQEPHLKAERFDVAHIAAAAALGYVHFRLGDTASKAMQPALSEWWAQAQTRASVAETAPVAS